jgi:hypothetical protein
MKQRCNRCRYWVKDDGQDKGVHRDDMIGRCHRHAPQPFASEWWHEILEHLVWLHPSAEDETVENTWEEAEYRGSTSWPPIYGGDWCGEFQANERSR